MRPRSLALIAGLTLLTSCSSYKKPAPAFHEELVQPYTLATSDEVRIIVFGQANLSNTYKIDQAGNLAFPLIGQVSATGQTPDELANIIRSRLQGGFVRDPDVSVEVAVYGPIFVMGEVNNAGQYAFLPGMTVQNIIATAGGFTARARQEDVDLTRQINGEIQSGRVLITAPVRPGDTLYVHERLF
ncbi:Polysaccharide biosynthesis/export protein [Pseudovibrio axinellae]|uniref:Polysaccharide biosynthesis/export protein n=1 Tax=Pseudovibrio axinellae TaxID=989403 RepID=A0A165WN43_9HYPH|nr:polysaccharide biosynthesis/export family protein [Pseudovibrio axinellae]KZL16720.1 Polysaccharide biosynthesis/export protein [Pseudovibrio axinellae]SEQ77441.1 polysaccharide export outer membrane protein [Pseudovibrio axinellae]